MEKPDVAILRKFVFEMHDVFRDTAAAIPGMPNIDVSVSEHRFLSLVCIMNEDKPEGIALKELAAAMKKAPATASELVERLVQKDLLQRVQNPKDRRAILITPTENTRKLMDESLRSIDAVCGKILAKLSAAEQEAVLRGLTKMVNSIQKA